MLDFLAQNEFSQEFAAMIEEQVMQKYGDILYREHPVSANHLPMSVDNRAAQFSPFAALTGHEEAIQETARLTDRRHEMDEESTRLLNERYHELLERFAEQPWISLTYFVPDDRKEGGKYVTVQSTVKKITEYERQLVLADERIISMSDIVSMQFLDQP